MYGVKMLLCNIWVVHRRNIIQRNASLTPDDFISQGRPLGYVL
jgi:hypothetical protein